jgi:hypothetical protein
MAGGTAWNSVVGIAACFIRCTGRICMGSRNNFLTSQLLTQDTVGGAYVRLLQLLNLITAGWEDYRAQQIWKDKRERRGSGRGLFEVPCIRLERSFTADMHLSHLSQHQLESSARQKTVPTWGFDLSLEGGFVIIFWGNSTSDSAVSCC